ncbi:MAG: hypothetical protein IJ087_14750, partial [Eggerthellaceae bacterium]|nr:hypothetical protein [Eggerthellaceae bacterium]
VDSELNESINRYKNDCDRLGIDPVIAEDEIRGHIDEDNQASDEEKVDKAMLKLKYVSLLNEKSEELKSASDQHAVDSVDHMRLLTNKQFDVAREEGRLGKTKSQIATVDAMITNLKHWRDELAESY